MISGKRFSTRIVTATLAVSAILFWTRPGISAVSEETDNNILLNSELRSEASGVPANWKVTALPNCGFSFVSHQSSDGVGEFDLINEEPAESSLMQIVQLKPGWYDFTAEIKVETLGSAGGAPELFVKSMTLPVSINRHRLGLDKRLAHAAFALQNWSEGAAGRRRS